MFDWIKGFTVAVLSGMLGAIIQCLDTGALPSLSTLKSSLIIGLSGGGAYIIKNVFTNSEGKLASEPKTEIK